MIKGLIQEEDIIIVNIHIYIYIYIYTHTHTHKIGVPQYIKEILICIKGEIDSNTIIVGDFNTPPISMDRSSK